MQIAFDRANDHFALGEQPVGAFQFRFDDIHDGGQSFTGQYDFRQEYIQNGEQFADAIHGFGQFVQDFQRIGSLCQQFTGQSLALFLFAFFDEFTQLFQ